jgi:DNA-binding CsgD family transcriptional regulator
MEVEEARQAIERAANVTDLFTVLKDMRDQTDLAHLVYHAASVPTAGKENPLLVLTYDDTWVRRYVEADYFQIDPVIQASVRGFLPVDWLNVDQHGAQSRHFFQEAQRYGVGRHGMTIPIRGPEGELALFTINADVSDEHWHRWRFSYLRDLHLLAHYFHDRAMRVTGLRHVSTMRPLARREKQCLEGIMRGQTPGQISSSLNLSISAVHAYLRTARRKLECATLPEAVGKAIRLELLR